MTSPNRLAAQTSPYLLQHAHNPVDWYPWGEEALRKARGEDKPILLSIGYSACHWCHVMAHESFEDAEVAAVMNRLFVNIKVDREERPDLDQIYQAAHSLLTRRGGGWPLTMFLTPEQKPFFGGTYFPKSARYGLPAFASLLEQVAAAFRDQRAAIEEQNAALIEALQGTQPVPGESHAALDGAAITAVIADLTNSFDRQHGGFGGAPKFPHPAELEFCLYFARREPQLQAHALLTLERMACGGIYDQLGGGFSRYSVDQSWTIPHFEKMLYDNGPMLGLYADAWKLGGNTLYRTVAEDTAAWTMREMQSPQGGYYSSLDADSGGGEGLFYIWSRDEIRALLDDEEYAVVGAHYGLDHAPNFEDVHWHLFIAAPVSSVAAKLNMPMTRAREKLAGARDKLYRARAQRARPPCDDKILVSWNALMIRGMARAARVFGRPDWLDSARRAVAFVAEQMFDGTRLLATSRDGRAHLDAYLDDYAFMILALLELMQADFRTEELELARAISDALLDQFEDPRQGGFFFVAHQHEPLILKTKPGQDGATPAGNAVAALALQRMGYLLGESRYLVAAERTLRLFAPVMVRHPGGFATMNMALAEALQPTRSLILRGSGDQLAQWRQALADCIDPATQIFALDRQLRALPPVLDKPAGKGSVNAYLCQGVNCLRPVDELAAIRSLLEAAKVGEN